MALKYDLDINSAYNFALLAPAVLGAGYSSAVLAGILDYSSAILIDDVTAKHGAVLPSLPSGTPSNPKSLIYLKLLTTTGNTVVIAQDWISTAPQLVQATQAVVTISNISTNDIARLREVLTSNNFTSFSIEQTS